MLISLAFFALAAILAPALTRVLGPRIFYVAALVPLGALIPSIAAAPTVLAGGIVRESIEWVPQIHLALSLRLDTLSWIMTLIVLGVGSLVLFYCERYFSNDEPGLGRFAGFFIAFSGAMYGLVVADDIFLMFMFWEATTVFSYLLIGHYTDRKASRGAALQALLVTTAGGLTMFVGLVVMAAAAGTTSFTGIMADPPNGTTVTVSVFLILVGALSKSALVPFHFWLPAAMAAPTPVSAYLHAAAMVKAGIFLIAAMAPAFAEIAGWREVLVGFGVLTMLVGGWRALRQTDIKLLLAYGTVSQLGFLTVIAGYGTQTAALAALALLVAHALFKSALFLVVGLIDHSTGTRDLRKLSGLGRSRPALAAIATLAVASMVGLPPLFGFVAKEAVFTAFLDGTTLGLIALVGVAVGSMFTVAYGARFLWGAFARKPDVADIDVKHDRADALASPFILSLAGLGLGLASGWLDPFFRGYAELFPPDGENYHLALWHGIEPALAISAITLVVGLLLFWKRARVSVAQARVPAIINSADGYWRVLRFVDRTAARITSTTQRGSLPFYLSTILLMLVLAVGTTLVLNRTWPSAILLWDYPAQIAIAVIMIVAAIASVRADKRFTAVVLVGVTGYGMAMIFALQGAPDLAFTQMLVETVTLIAFVLVLRRLPRRIGVAHGRPRYRALRAALAIAVGLTMAVVVVVVLSARVDEPIFAEFARLALEKGHGANVVNVALVDERAWDTMGELSVVIVAATGVASLIFLDRRTDDLARPKLPRGRRRLFRQKPITEPARRPVAAEDDTETMHAWLLAGRTLAPENRSILLEMTVRLAFHSIMVVSFFVLFSGHNAPGGGFAAGLIAGMALVARYLAGGRYELGAAVTIDAGKLLGSGMLLAAGTAVAPLFFGADALTSAFFEAEVPIFGHIEFVTSTIFDVGVYLVVIGLVLDVLRSLGGEVDRQQEEEDPNTPNEHLDERVGA
ncbi:Na+/H+ antiporter subunit A [Homoserinimonas hongtaonis]|uniref:Na+/H+ antiporter subunit A n=1 Tax=Homoserinimonas hongtaonis TaxID=2079791 RepID=UPI000D37DF3B|nr:Na+/H+ antiporter subunit A [Salinibacterium hongtaonis]AWB88698.1 Na+/H+ antiporter subunit A [Salinibacterium hongtaonis]